MKVRVASAGTGKTTSLVARYVELVECGTPLRRIAGVTFTRAAAAELRQRVEVGLREMLATGTYLNRTLLEPMRPRFEEALRETGGATLTTIHGFMTDALRLSAPMMGLDSDFSVLSEWEARALFEEELASLRYLSSDPKHGLHGAFRLLGDDANRLLLTLFGGRSLVESYVADDHPIHEALLAIFEAVYKRFELRLGAALLPPSEVERRALRLVGSRKALSRLAGRYRVVLVDEFQDVNPLQGRFFRALEAGGVRVEAVGDPKQSIYGFRHADVGVFRRALVEGERLPPLDQTRRHAPVLNRFLNHMTRTFAEEGMGFGHEEAPEVSVAGERAQAEGRVELHWVTGDEPVGVLRVREADILASRLRAFHEQGYPYSEMAVLARSYAGLALVEGALERAGLPYVFVQGRGYFERLEVRDLYHALRVGLDARGLSLAAWLRSPFARLELAEVDRLLQAEDPVARLEADHPQTFRRLERIRQGVRGTPLEALKFLIREPFLDGERYVDALEPRERENVDALLFTVSQGPPGSLEILLDRLESLSRQADAGDVPQSGEGIALSSVHRAKGLEWPVVAVFDLGRSDRPQTALLYIDPADGGVCCREGRRFDEVKALYKTREAQESYRLLYVAASRARNVLLMTGSVKGGRAAGWAEALCAMNVGFGDRPYNHPDFVMQVHPYGDASEPRGCPAGSLRPERLPSVAAPYIDRHFPRHPHPPVTSPSRAKEAHEPLPFSDPDEGERLPGRATTVGTLVHYAISQNWRADNPAHLENLRAQEVMFPFTPGEQLDILEEVRSLLVSYERLLGRTLPALERRSEDHPELPVALPQRETVWQGIIDRLYCADGVWYLEDYKTDHETVPERYHFQLAVYLEAVRAVRGVTPRVRLVFLRSGEVVEVSPERLEAAFREA